MNQKEILARFPNASASFCERNTDGNQLQQGQVIIHPESKPKWSKLKTAWDELETAFVMQPSTDESKLNKTERAYLAHLRLQPENEWIGIQCITLKLGDNVRYTVDFWTLSGGILTGHEVKGGFFRDDAKVKLKVAARMYRWARFVLVRKNRGQWDVSAVQT